MLASLEGRDFSAGLSRDGLFTAAPRGFSEIVPPFREQHPSTAAAGPSAPNYAVGTKRPAPSSATDYPANYQYHRSSNHSDTSAFGAEAPTHQVSPAGTVLPSYRSYRLSLSFFTLPSRSDHTRIRYEYSFYALTVLSALSHGARQYQQ